MLLTGRVWAQEKTVPAPVDFTMQEPANTEAAATAAAGFQVSVYDSSGQLRWKLETPTSFLRFDISRLSRGLYRVLK